MLEAGHDPLAVVAARAKEHGMQLVPVLLLNQGRGPREGDSLDVRCSEWRFENPQLELGARSPRR
jgi:hypothetical protein